jgi:X-Pro dipeptidyl-peptidase
VRRELLITTDVDTDDDGHRDRVHAHLVRPPDSDVGGRRLATVIWASPYFACCGDAPNHVVDVPLYVPGDTAGRAFGQPSAAAAADFARVWVPQGYAVLVVESLGTAGSTGCPTIGDDNEAAGPKAAIDWLNGRATGRTPQGRFVGSGWASGKAGMVGVSYDGTLPNMVAATGVEGLKAIIAEAAISRWYDYYRQDGLIVAPGGYQGEDADVLATFNYTRANRTICRPVIRRIEREQDRVTGDYNAFWAARDLVGRASQVKAAVLVTHGLSDTNVRTTQSTQWYAALRAAGVERAIYLGPGAHGSNAPLSLQRRWFAHYLYGVDNGVDRGPRAHVATSSGRVRAYAEWPAPDAQPATFTLQPASGSNTGTLIRGAAPPAASESFTDAATRTARDLVIAPNPFRGRVYLTPALTGPTLLSGAPVVHLGLSFSHPAANVTAGLVLITSGGQVITLSEGWTDPQNRGSWSVTEPVTVDTTYDLVVRLQSTDRLLRSGDRLALVVLSTDREHTLRPPAGTQVSIDLERSELILPLADR